MFEDKRMYFPFDTKFDELDGKKVVVDILSEQQEMSPHLYIKDDIVVKEKSMYPSEVFVRYP